MKNLTLLVSLLAVAGMALAQDVPPKNSPLSGSFTAIQGHPLGVSAQYRIGAVTHFLGRFSFDYEASAGLADKPFSGIGFGKTFQAADQVTIGLHLGAYQFGGEKLRFGGSISYVVKF